jgi:Flp pilus assembly protein TadD
MINVGLLGWLVWRAAEDRRRLGASGARPEVIAPVAALLFAVHPMMTGAVGYISARPEVLCGTFVLLALLAARLWMIGRGGIWLGATVALWLVALGAKETAVVFPAVVLAYDRWILAGDGAKRGAPRRLMWLHGPLFGLAAVVTAIRLFVFVFIEQGGSVDFQWPLAWVELDVVRRYLMMLIAPIGQSIFHPVTLIDGFLQPRALIDITVFGVCGWVIWSQRRARPFLSFGLVWFLAFVLPSSLLVMLNRGEPMAEHRIYLASCGAFIVAGALADRLWALMAAGQRATRVVLVAGFIAVLVTLGGRTLLRNALFGHPVLVWLDAAELAPNDWLPHRLLGEELHRAGDHAQAIGAFTRAIELAPGEVSAYGKLGVCLTEQGDLGAAEAAFSKMRGLDAQSPEASNGLATIALLRGNLDAAKRGYLDTLALDSGNVAARRGLAVVAEAPGGNPADALRWCQEIKRLDPDAAGIDDCIKRNAAKIGGGR